MLHSLHDNEHRIVETVPALRAELRIALRCVPRMCSSRRPSCRRKFRTGQPVASASSASVSPSDRSQRVGEEAREAVRKRLSRRPGRFGPESNRCGLEGPQRRPDDPRRGLPRGSFPQVAAILALDLGSKTGWATLDVDTGRVEAGTWVLVPEKVMKPLRQANLDRRLDPRVPSLWEHINVQLEGMPANTLVVFEDVQFSVYTAQTQLWASLRAAVWLSDASLFDCCPVGTLKRFATGHGGADKEAMRAAFERTTPFHASAKLDDNAIDALHLLRWAKWKYSL